MTSHWSKENKVAPNSGQAEQDEDKSQDAKLNSGHGSDSKAQTPSGKCDPPSNVSMQVVPLSSRPA
ncbi:hypothetical protein E4U41_000769 [Claviceps citrina]|nr:hypothetical protein E4U41_000769 [Claviceps citrina]